VDPAVAAISGLSTAVSALVAAVVVLWRQNTALQAQRVEEAKAYAAQLLQMSRDTTGALGAVSNALGGVREAQAEIKTLLKDVDAGVEQIDRRLPSPPRR